MFDWVSRLWTRKDTELDPWSEMLLKDRDPKDRERLLISHIHGLTTLPQYDTMMTYLREYHPKPCPEILFSELQKSRRKLTGNLDYETPKMEGYKHVFVEALGKHIHTLETKFQLFTMLRYLRHFPFHDTDYVGLWREWEFMFGKICLSDEERGLVAARPTKPVSKGTVDGHFGKCEARQRELVGTVPKNGLAAVASGNGMHANGYNGVHERQEPAPSVPVVVPDEVPTA